ncbi:MAG: hypothetical protein P4M11_04570 [Candidatus Pacebacteria bacterium]|nr:hypothetical protein [Candidatus Paceibacterota bacterium]
MIKLKVDSEVKESSEKPTTYRLKGLEMSYASEEGESNVAAVYLGRDGDRDAFHEEAIENR